MKKQEKRRIQRKIALACIFVEFFIMVAFLFVYLPKIMLSSPDVYRPQDDRSNCIMLVGFSEDAPLLRRAYDGAIRAAEKYDSVVELHIQDSGTAPENFHDLIDFAHYSGADGIIVYVPEKMKFSSKESCRKVRLRIPCAPEGMQFSKAAENDDESHVPLVSIGNCLDGMEQVSSIGGNYSEMGKKLADEVLGLWENGMTLLIFDSFSARNSNYLSIRDAFISRINSNGIKDFLNLDHSVNSYKTMLATYLNRFNRLQKKVMVVSLSESDSLYAAQKISMLSYISSANVIGIGIGENKILKKYLDAGIVSVLVSMDYEKMGEDAVTEIFDCKSGGHSSKVIPADIKIIRADGI